MQYIRKFRCYLIFAHSLMVILLFCVFIEAFLSGMYTEMIDLFYKEFIFGNIRIFFDRRRVWKLIF